MKTYILSIFLLLTFFSCKQIKDNDINTQVAIINDCFLDMIDTLGYQYHTLRPASSDSMFADRDSMGIGIYPRLINPDIWETSILGVLQTVRDSAKHAYLKLFEKLIHDSTEYAFDTKRITNKGKYILISESNKYPHKIRGRVGSIIFSRVYYDEKMGIGLVVAEISDNNKSGIAKLFLLQKKGAIWNKTNEYELEVW